MRRLDPTLLGIASAFERGAGMHPPTGTVGPCPIDLRRLERVTVVDVELDVCRRHGTWFDAGELRKVGERFEQRRAAEAEALPEDVRRVLETVAGVYRSSGRRS